LWTLLICEKTVANVKRRHAKGKGRKNKPRGSRTSAGGCNGPEAGRENERSKEEHSKVEAKKKGDLQKIIVLRKGGESEQTKQPTNKKSPQRDWGSGKSR